MQASANRWDIKLLYDGECPLCVREVRLLERLDCRRFDCWLARPRARFDRRAQRLALEDIAAADFEPSRYGRTMAELMGHVHAVLPDGELITGMEVFRQVYTAVGLGALTAPTGWPVLRPLFDAAYGWFARNRLRITGRGHISLDLCESGRCAVPAGKSAK